MKMNLFMDVEISREDKKQIAKEIIGEVTGITTNHFLLDGKLYEETLYYPRRGYEITNKKVIKSKPNKKDKIILDLISDINKLK